MRFDINNKISTNAESSLIWFNERDSEINSELEFALTSSDIATLVLAESYTHKYLNSALTVVLVILVHLTLLLALDSVWEPTDLSVPTTTPSKLNAYIYYELKETVKAVPLSGKQSDNKRPVESEDTDEKKTVEIENILTRESLLTQVIHVDETNNDAADMEQVNMIETEQPAWLNKDKESVQAQAYFSSDIITPSTVSISSLNALTQEYFSRERDALLGKLSVNAAAQYTQVKTLSEMDGEMIELELPVEDEWLTAKTLDHKLDPNRIVRQGNTCYRVVKTPNPINPHAENLGYPFRCDGDSVAAALKRAIAKRVYKRPIN
ncbi:hypothetical protein FM038_010940 [Shewanella eurypsychrophilus]|uniref:Uncharacterized protein n=1 Tax=Shewanella eurypsychrophilus TaxID=2593656 RepID=A0ABX6V6E6_9GAMM|nr:MULTISPECIES: hypothetical protein [Shewanella]QFU22625.1 hypothetical protein FS418_12520 [Shewanella sp. YLB-09]QPG57914.1 hypothetical protein FM038_010940 [Shewanella eurypsychrophilus]